MRTNKEIDYVVSILIQKGDRLSKIQAEVLKKRLTEKAVFEQYVAGVANEDKDEAVFFAARDAARYLTGSIALEELIPDAEEVFQTDNEVSVPESSGDMVLVSKRTLQNLLLRVSRLELMNGIRTQPIKVNRKRANGSEPEDLISQVEVIRLLECGKTTIKRWADRGYITGYQKGGRVYYSRKELRKCQIVKEYLIASGKDKEVKL